VSVLCEEAGLSPSLNVILDSIKVGFGKPDPRIFELALNELAAKPAETVFVEIPTNGICCLPKPGYEDHLAQGPIRACRKTGTGGS